MNFVKILKKLFHCIIQGFNSIFEGMSTFTLFPPERLGWKKKFRFKTQEEINRECDEAIRKDWENVFSNINKASDNVLKEQTEKPK